MHDFNLRDDNLLDNMDELDDKFLKEDKFLTRIILVILAEKQESDDWEYLKKTVQAKDGKYLRYINNFIIVTNSSNIIKSQKRS